MQAAKDGKLNVEMSGLDLDDIDYEKLDNLKGDTKDIVE